MTTRRGRCIAALLAASVAGSTGCMRAASTISPEPSSLYVRQLCPALEYQVVGEFNEAWTGFGFLGLPLNDTPNFAEVIAKQVAKLGGDAAIDVRTSSNLYLFYALLYAQVHPRHRVSGKVIKYTSRHCTR